MAVDTTVYKEIEGTGGDYYSLVGWLGVMIAAGLGSTYYMEHHGHVVTGMSNAVVWGTPHVFRSEEHTSELQSHHDLVCRLLLEKKKTRIRP